MAWGSKKSSGGGPAWLALLVALVALWIAWTAYRRTGGTFDTLVANPVSLSPGERVGERGMGSDAPPAELPAEAEERDWRAALDRARERLLSRRDEVEQDRDLEAVQRDITEIRTALERAWRGAGEGAQEARQKWKDLDAELGRLQKQVKDGSERARETLDGVVQRLRDAT